MVSKELTGHLLDAAGACIGVAAWGDDLRRAASGPVAQWLEPTAHNGLVAGSSPAGPTNKIN